MRMFWSFLIVVMATYSSAWASNECLAVESFQVDDTCNTVLGWGWTGGTCEEISGCSTTDLNGNDLAPYLHADEWGCYEGCAACPVVDPSDFGLCSMILGIAWTGSSCDYVSGCSTVDGAGVDRANWFFDSGDLDADMAACEQSCDGCPDLSLSDFGQCKMLLGHGWDGKECAPVSGCDRIDANTQEDQSAWIFPSDEECGERCEQCDVVDRDGFGQCKMLMGWAWTGATCESISGCNATDIYGVDWSGSLHSSYTSCLKDCHPTTRLYEPDPGQAGVKNSIRVGGVPQGEVVRLVKSKTLGSSTVTGCNGATMNLENPKVVGQGVANAKGNVKFKRKVSANLSGKYLYYQAINVDTCEVSNLVSHYYY